MSWFDRCVGDGDPAEAWERLNQSVERAGVGAAIASALGKRGLRCFVILFESRGGRYRVAGLSAEPLRQGGGPPTAAAWDDAVPALESALEQLARILGPTWRFERGAIGVVRDGAGQVDLRFRFDEDSVGWGLAQLRGPKGDPHPPEDPAYQRSMRAWESRIAAVRQRWEVARAGEAWSFTGGRLHAGTATPRKAEAIATWRGASETFDWLLGEPVAEELPFVEPSMALTLAEAVELVAFAAARRRDASVFQGTTPEGLVVFLGVHP